MSDMTIKVFENAEFGTVRTAIINGEPWFVANDVCKALEIDATATRRLDDDEKNTLRLTQGTSGNPNVTIVNESGLYNLVLGSRKPEAKAFKRWITHDVIPSIRKHGAYMTPEMIEQVLMNPDTIIKLATDLKNERAERLRLEQVNAVLEPKASYYDAILASPNSVTVTQIAKDYGMSAVRFNTLLHDLGIQYKASDGQWVLYQIYANECYTQSVTSYDSKGNSHMHTRWTQKGRLFLYNKLKDNGILPRRDEDMEEDI